MSYQAHTFAVAVLAIGLAALRVSSVSAAELSYEQTAAGRGRHHVDHRFRERAGALLLSGMGLLGWRAARRRD